MHDCMNVLYNVIYMYIIHIHTHTYTYTYICVRVCVLYLAHVADVFVRTRRRTMLHGGSAEGRRVRRSTRIGEVLRLLRLLRLRPSLHPGGCDGAPAWDGSQMVRPEVWEPKTLRRDQEMIEVSSGLKITGFRWYR